jgi:hypothetical protein
MDGVAKSGRRIRDTSWGLPDLMSRRVKEGCAPRRGTILKSRTKPVGTGTYEVPVHGMALMTSDARQTAYCIPILSSFRCMFLSLFENVKTT